MRNLLLLFILSLTISCNSQGKKPIKGETEYQRKENARFKDASKSPLTKKGLKDFKGLDFFKVDSSFVVTAKLTPTPEDPIFEMTTTTSRKPLYKRYGILSFTIQGKEFQLDLFKSQDFDRDPKYDDYLFLPFTDMTSGNESYAGGRYLDVFISKITKDNTVVLNFNNTYNPYCAYNTKYSCPIPPKQNHLRIPIKAGIKAYKKH